MKQEIIKLIETIDEDNRMLKVIYSFINNIIKKKDFN